MVGGKAMQMTQGFLRKRSVNRSMDSHGHQQVLYITVTLTKVILSSTSKQYVYEQLNYVLTTWWIQVYQSALVFSPLTSQLGTMCKSSTQAVDG